MKVRDVMKTNTVTVKLDDSIVEAARLMRDHGVGFLPVVDENNHVCGALTDRDIVSRVIACEALPNSTRVVDAMTLELVRCHADDDVEVAARAMADTHKGRVLVTGAEDVLEGVISLSDVVEADAAQGAATLQKVAARENKPTDHRAIAEANAAGGDHAHR